MQEFSFKNIKFRIEKDMIYIAECGNIIIPADSYELGRFVEISLTGENKDTHYGNKMICSSEGPTLKYQEHTIIDNTLSVIQKNDNIQVETKFVFFEDNNCIKINTTVTNVKEEDIFLDDVSAFFLGDIAYLSDSDKIYHYRFLQSHHAECQPRIASLFDEGLFKANPISQKRIGCCNIGSWSTKEELPQSIIENKLNNTFLMFQIESNNSWYYEISDYVDRIYLYLGGANANLGGWSKRLKRGESYTTYNAVLSFGSSVNEVIGEMTKYRRLIAGKCVADENLPCIFNEYMHLAWNGPDYKRTREIAKYAKSLGAEYYVIDCGWHDEVDPSIIFLYVGEWRESKARFPLGVKETSDYIHSLGMKFGLWIEPEVIGIKCQKMIDYYTDDCFLQRNGKRLAIMNRYLLDFRNQKVRDYLSETIRRMVEDYGADYIKIDYNQDAGVGTDYNSDSLGDGLEQSAKAYLDWVKEIRKKFPNVLFENCSSGGMRMDYLTMSNFSIASTSDQTDYRLYPYISSNIFAGILPEQGAVWSYPVSTSIFPEDNKFREEKEWIDKNIDEIQVTTNMVNSILGRMHLASHVELLSDKKRDLIKEGIDYYNSITQFKKKALPYFPLPFANFHSEFVSCGLVYGSKLLLAVWNMSEPVKRELSIENDILSAKIGYPKSSKIGLKHSGKTLLLDFSAKYEACIIEIELKK